jgi:drug/metabolite transporter (DMT)-like permease|nr:DMT family transporter [Candidatus Krumholzibacteria bacterium]
MDNARRNANLMLLLAAAIWGFSFVAQRVGMRHIGPMTFNAIRFALGALVLLPLLMSQNRRIQTRPRPPLRPLIRGGLLAGFFLFAGSTFQQFGMVYTTAGKAGFITGLYVLFVPVLGLLLGHRANWQVWTGALLAAGGLYLLSATSWTSIALGDGLVLLSALFWAGHVLMVGHLVASLPSLSLAVAQFLVCSFLSLIGALVFETWSWPAIQTAAFPILYAGIMSVGVAFTLQVVAQRQAKPAHTAIILSTESVFAAIGGWLLLGELLALRGLVGCALMLAGILLAQWEFKRKVGDALPGRLE